MSSWSGIRKKLETEYLAPSLRGHIQYYATSYSRSPDHEGRAAIRYDGKEIIKGCYYNNWIKADLFPKDKKYEKRMKEEFAFMDDTALRLGIFVRYFILCPIILKYINYLLPSPVYSRFCFQYHLITQHIYRNRQTVFLQSL